MIFHLFYQLWKEHTTGMYGKAECATSPSSLPQATRSEDRAGVHSLLTASSQRPSPGDSPMSPGDSPGDCPHQGTTDCPMSQMPSSRHTHLFSVFLFTLPLKFERQFCTPMFFGFPTQTKSLLAITSEHNIHSPSPAGWSQTKRWQTLNCLTPVRRFLLWLSFL